MKKNIKEIAELNKWQYVPLSTLFSFQYGDGNTNPSNGGKYPVYGANGIIGGYDKYNSESAIIIGHMGENAGSVIWEDKKHFVTYNGTITTSKDEKKLFLKYGYYNLLNLNLRKICAGSGQPFLSYDDLNRLYTTLPNLPTQKKIVTVLSALDYKIALNRRMNTKLEQMSKRLYNHWFVQFDFPNADGKPYKSSGGKMEYNETLKREIPEGWKVKRLGDVCEIVLGGTPSTANNEFWDNGTISWLNSGEVGIFPIVESEKKITEIAVEKSTTEFLKAGSVTLSITRYLRPSILAIDACINQSVVGIKENDLFKNCFLYPYLQNEIDRLMSLRTGAQQPHINKKIVEDSFINIPPKELMEKYEKKVTPIYLQIINIAKETQKLTVLRDRLLPLLMNGQVEVK